jgi:hypothetical protein
MKIPDKIRIGGIDYKVEQTDGLIDGVKVLDGQIDYGGSVIRLSARDNAHQAMCVTLLHEILHGIAHHANLDLGEAQEKIVDVLAYGIYQILQDNGRKLFDVVESDPN